MESVKLLIIEDDSSDAELIREMLAEAEPDSQSGFGFHLTHAERLSTGLVQLTENNIDLILLDLSLPDGHGLETFFRLHAHVPDLPIIVLTGWDDELLASQSIQAGAQSFLVKGELNSRLLQRTIRDAIERHRLLVELKQQSQALLHSESRFQTMIEHNVDGIVIVDEAGIVRFVNPAAEALFDRPADELLDQPFDFPVAVDKTVRLNLTTGTGEPAVVEMRATEIAWEGEIAYLASLRDITQRVQAEEALRKSEKEYRNLVDNALVGVYKTNLNGDVLYANEALAQIFEFETQQEFIAAGVTTRYANSEDRIAFIEKLKQTGRIESVELDLITRTGIPRQVLLSAVLEGEVIEGIIVDITERKRAEDALRENEEKYRTLFENAPIGLGVADFEGNLLTFNKAMLEPGGYAPEDITNLGNVARLYCDPAERGEVLEIIQNHGAVRQYETQFKRKDGTCYDAILSLIPTTMDGKPCFQAMVQDITERKQLEEQYYQAQKMEAIGQLTGGVAHDFNNLLTAINGFAELLQMRLPPDDPLQEMVDKILGSGQRAADLVSQLLAFSRKQLVEPQMLNLNEVVANIDKMLQRIIGENIQIQTHLASNAWLVKIDPTQIEQIILNLAVNARDAMPEGGRLTIETANVILDENYVASHLEAQPGEHVLLAVSDTGVGMSREMQSRIFEPFFTTKSEGHGTGLGLATVYGIVKQNGGNIWVYSEEGQGTTFKIYLPRAKEPVRPRYRLDSEIEVATGTETILLVEDDATVRELARRVLQMQGYTLLEAQDAQEALHLSTRYTGPLHLLVTDVIMPGISGKVLADQLRQTYPEIKILFMSGYTNNAIAHHGVLDSDVVFLQKPFGPVALARKVRQVLDTL